MSVLWKVERYLRQTGMAETKFGRLALNDSRLVRDLRGGREPGSRTAARIEAFIDMRIDSGASR
ncbi:hypothetical protein ACVWZA_001918 [Sphingomonas sp. UYAg733]